jgi:hypothetical protein
MKTYIRTQTLTWGFDEDAIRAAHPDLAIPSPLLPEHALTLGYAEIHPTEPPAHDTWDILIELPPEQEDGDWYQRWQVAPGEAPPPQVPQVVSRFQARAVLHLTGFLEAAETFINAPETDMMIKLAWHDAQEFRRDSPMLSGVAQVLALTEADLDAMFIQASQITA